MQIKMRVKMLSVFQLDELLAVEIGGRVILRIIISNL